MSNVVRIERDDPMAQLGARVLERLDDVVPGMGAAYVREVAEYAAMDEQHFAHVLATSRSFVVAFAEQLRDGVGRPVPDHARLTAAGRRRQTDGISLDAAMHAFRIASRVGWTAFADVASDEAPDLVAEVASRWIEYADRAATAFAEGHVSGATEKLRRLDTRRQVALTDLLAAADTATASAVAARHGLQLSSRYTPIVCSEPVDVVGSIMTTLPADVLAGHRGHRFIALVPTATDPGTTGLDLTALAAHGVVVTGRPAAPGAALRDAVASAELSIEAALATGRTSGVTTSEQLVLDRVVREHDDLRRKVQEQVLEPLQSADRDRIFRDTLRAYLGTGSLPKAAETLFVHPNTVSYRLRRVRDITGLDPRVPVEAAYLVLAMALDGGTP